jgi:hypothetical protein
VTSTVQPLGGFSHPWSLFHSNRSVDNRWVVRALAEIAAEPEAAIKLEIEATASGSLKVFSTPFAIPSVQD